MKHFLESYLKTNKKLKVTNSVVERKRGKLMKEREKEIGEFSPKQLSFIHFSKENGNIITKRMKNSGRSRRK